MAAEQSAAFGDALDRIGVDPVVHTPDAFARLIEDDVRLWRDAIPALGMTPQ
jgi:tripartite-type tricarboxylate transporter receptor subunit TctC